MKGVIEDFSEWTYDNCASVLEEAGLSLVKGRTDIYKCDALDATEVISVLEMWYDVQFSQREHNRLFALMRRGHIGRPSLMNWLSRCHEKPVRKRAESEVSLPLFVSSCEAKSDGRLADSILKVCADERYRAKSRFGDESYMDTQLWKFILKLENLARETNRKTEGEISC